MVKQEIKVHNLSNGMTLVAEKIREVSSGAFVFLLPAGSARDPVDRGGAATVLSELLFRGAGSMDNRALNERLDSLGLQRHSSISSTHMALSGALVADKLLETIGVYADIICRARLEIEHFALCRELALQSLDSLEDDPRQKIGLLVREQYFPYPFGRPAPGKKQDLQDLEIEDVKSHWQSRFSPRGTILAAAGNIDLEKLIDVVETHFGTWRGDAPDELIQNDAQEKFYHQQHEGAQIHIGLMYPSVHVKTDDYYRALAAVEVLSGGMGSRLFTEVREKRGLCYAVGARHHINGPYGAVQCYVGSSPDRAQEALDVMIAELVKLSQGITQDELDRAKVGLRASLIMQGESTQARAGACAGDFYHFNRVRSLEEIENAVLSLTVQDVLEFVKQHPAQKFTIATVGPRELKVKK